MNPVQLFDNGNPTEAWKCGRCQKVHSSIEGGTFDGRSSENRCAAEECCTCERCGAITSTYEWKCNSCRASERTKGPPHDVEVLTGYEGPVRCETIGFADSVAEMMVKLSKFPASSRPAWAWVASRDPDGVKNFESFMRDLQYEDSFPVERLDPQSIEHLRAAFDRFNEANRAVAPLFCDRTQIVMLDHPEDAS